MAEFKGFEDAMLDNWKEQMASVMKSIDLRIADVLAEGRTPTCFLCHERTLNEIISYCGGVPEDINWSEPVHLDFYEGTVKLTLYRTVDLKRGQVIIP